LLEAFERADKITQVRDMISFDFCFESPRWRMYEIRPDGEARLDPRPFSVPISSGIVYPFERQGCPKELNPIIIPLNMK
jgi:hypothetical protein